MLRFAGATDWKAGFTRIEAGAEKSYLVQFAWPLFEKDDGQSRAYGQPFLVTLTAKADGIYPTMEGLPGIAAAPATHGSAPAPSLSAAPPLPAPLPKPVDSEVTRETGPPAKFAIEAAVRNSHLMAGGREVLFELEGAPYWKRFSFEKNDWLPLPAGDLSNASLTGNLGALFVLDRGAGEIRKYLLPALQPAGSVKLPAPVQYFAILAGSNSDHSPVHVLAAEEAMALAPETLQRRDVPLAPGHTDPNGDRKFSRTDRYAVSGDGLCIWNSASFSFARFYNSDERGLERNYFDTHGSMGGNEPLGVTGAFRMGSGLESLANPGGSAVRVPQNLPWEWISGFSRIAKNAPVIFHFARALNGLHTSSPALVRCFSYFAISPFAVVEVPEFTDDKSFPRTPEWQGFDWMHFDPYSFRLGTIAQDRKTWFVHSLIRPQKLAQPVLLNWPDTSIPRGGEFHFKPLLLGGDQFTAEIFSRPGRAAVNSADGTIRCPWGALDFDSLELLNLKVPGAGVGELTYPISLHAVGMPPPFVARAAFRSKDLNSLGTGFKSFETPTNEFHSLSSTIHFFQYQVIDIQGPVSGCAALVSANRIDFLSLQTRKMVGATAIPTGALYYAGAGALIEYDPAKRSLTRISVPDGRRERTLTLPQGVTIAGLGMGTERGSPITLALNLTEAQGIIRFSDLTITAASVHNLLTVLDGNTLQAAGWMQPVSLAHILNKPEQDNPWAFLLPPGEAPRVLPASHNGCIVTLADFLLVLSPSYSISYPIGSAGIGNGLHDSGQLPLSGSISGLMATSATGEVFKGGSKIPGGQGWKLGSTPCGRYRMVRLPTSDPLDRILGVQLAETGADLFVGGRFSFFQQDQFSHLAHPLGRHFAMLGDDGPLAILSATGRELQLVDLDIPAIMKALEPTEFHVVSQPIPCVMEGGALQYQVKVNNPEAVKTIRLQSPIPGLTMTPEGALQFIAPTHITDHTQINIAIEIEGKNGNTVLHEFPVFVLPRLRAAAKPQTNPI